MITDCPESISTRNCAIRIKSVDTISFISLEWDMVSFFTLFINLFMRLKFQWNLCLLSDLCLYSDVHLGCVLARRSV